MCYDLLLTSLTYSLLFTKIYLAYQTALLFDSIGSDRLKLEPRQVSYDPHDPRLDITH